MKAMGAAVVVAVELAPAMVEAVVVMVRVYLVMQKRVPLALLVAVLLVDTGACAGLRAVASGCQTSSAHN
jgi:hypothetical protein